MKGDLHLMLDWAENDCDSIIYWLRSQDDVRDIMSHLERQIKPAGASGWWYRIKLPNSALNICRKR